MTIKEVQALILWYQKNKRDLPWRTTSDPYKIWISEIMLQQTRVEAVKNYYQNFIQQLPTIEDLAKVKEDTLLKLWEGLGYYTRARNLKKCAIEVKNLGLKTLPSEEKELKKLPGIGDYTSGAILSIAYHKCTPAIDGNVIRILSRIYEEERDWNQKQVKEEYTHLLKTFMTEENARDFTEGFIELGAIVCIPNGLPHCAICPFAKVCKSYQENKMLEFPKKKEKKKRKVVHVTVFIFTKDGKYYIEKRTQKGLLHGLYEFYSLEKNMTEKEIKEYLNLKKIPYTKIQFIDTFHHLFTHLEWEMKAYVITTSKDNKNFYSKQELESKFSLPTAFRKILKHLK